MTVYITKHFTKKLRGDFSPRIFDFVYKFLHFIYTLSKEVNKMNDTEKLLRECNSGIKMGVDSINHVMPYVKSEELKKILNACKDKHAVLGDTTHKALLNSETNTKNPHPVAKIMADMTTRMKITMHPTDNEIASIMTDGCNMGIKSLYKYLNEYKGADENSVEITNRLIAIEKELRTDMRSFL